jgi:hypothetical protein
MEITIHLSADAYDAYSTAEPPALLARIDQTIAHEVAARYQCDAIVRRDLPGGARTEVDVQPTPEGVDLDDMVRGVLAMLDPAADRACDAYARDAQ